MTRYVKVLLAMLYIPCSVWTYGAVTADVDHFIRREIQKYGTAIACSTTPDYDAGFMAFRWGMAAAPVVGWAAGLITTGFYEHGWKAHVTACADAGYKETAGD